VVALRCHLPQQLRLQRKPLALLHQHLLRRFLREILRTQPRLFDLILQHHPQVVRGHAQVIIVNPLSK
jgi:hypothetical protein